MILGSEMLEANSNILKTAIAEYNDQLITHLQNMQRFACGS
jgi:hypothetical protein